MIGLFSASNDSRHSAFGLCLRMDHVLQDRNIQDVLRGRRSHPADIHFSHAAGQARAHSTKAAWHLLSHLSPHTAQALDCHELSLGSSPLKPGREASLCLQKLHDRRRVSGSAAGSPFCAEVPHLLDACLIRTCPPTEIGLPTWPCSCCSGLHLEWGCPGAFPTSNHLAADHCPCLCLASSSASCLPCLACLCVLSFSRCFSLPVLPFPFQCLWQNSSTSIVQNLASSRTFWRAALRARVSSLAMSRETFLQTFRSVGAGSLPIT